jgi:hypothetical protein
MQLYENEWLRSLYQEFAASKPEFIKIKISFNIMFTQ